MLSFKDFILESKRSAVEAGIQRASKAASKLSDKVKSGVTPADMDNEADQHDAKYKEHMDAIRGKLTADRNWMNSSEHKSLLRKANTHMSKAQNLRNDAENVRYHHNKGI